VLGQVSCYERPVGTAGQAWANSQDLTVCPAVDEISYRPTSCQLFLAVLQQCVWRGETRQFLRAFLLDHMLNNTSLSSPCSQYSHCCCPALHADCDKEARPVDLWRAKAGVIAKVVLTMHNCLPIATQLLANCHTATIQDTNNVSWH
jgi:hypothetical protein